MTYEELENTRKKYLERREQIKQKITKIMGTILVVVLLFELFAAARSSFSFASIFHMVVLVGQFFIIGAIVYFVITTFKTSKEYEEFKKAYKAHFVSEALSKTITDYTYQHDSGISSTYLQSCMIHTGDRYNTNDYVTGMYKDAKFAQADVTIQEEHTDSDGDRTYVTIFRGRFVVFEFKKKFDFKLSVIGKNFRAYRLPKEKDRKFKKIKIESNEFHKNFQLYGQDGFEAFYLLDPAMIERITALGAKYNNKVILNFVDNRLIVGINDNKDSFEPSGSIKNPIDEHAEFEKVYNDIKVVTDLVDNLKIR